MKEKQNFFRRNHFGGFKNETKLPKILKSLIKIFGLTKKKANYANKNFQNKRNK